MRRAALATLSASAVLAVGALTAGSAEALPQPAQYGQPCQTLSGQQGYYQWANPDNSAFSNNLVCRGWNEPPPRNPNGSWGS